MKTNQLTGRPRRGLAVAMLCAALAMMCPRAGAQIEFRADGGKAKGPKVKARLVADTAAVEPSKPFRVGFLYTLAPHWHIYSKVPGEIGLATGIEWTPPEGFAVGELQWPEPQKFNDAGLVSYGYTDEVLLFATVTPPADLKAGAPVLIQAKTRWLVCKLDGECIPGEGEDEIELVVGAAAPSESAPLFDKYAPLVKTSGPGLSPAHEGAPDETKPGANTPTAASTTDLGTLPGEKTPRPTAREGGGPPFSFLKERKADGGAAAALLMLLFAFGGGLLLNVMPCVLPVISIKALSFARQARDDRKAVLRLGMAFTAGVLSSFAILAILVIVLQSAGASLGWGFQFQEPRFVIVMAAIALTFAMSLFGVFEIEFPGAALDRVEGLQHREGPQGAFFNGALATALATPCTAPMLGPALGFAFSQPPPMIFLFFMTIAAGLASPYMLLSAYPGWMRLLPKPGAWMETFKQFMGFLLIATVVWLMWVLGRMTGSDGMAAALAFLAAVGLACWIVGRGFDLRSGRRRRWTLGTLALIVVAGAYLYFPERNLRALGLARADIIPAKAGEPGNGGAADADAGAGPGAGPGAGNAGVAENADAPKIAWTPYSADAIEVAVAAGRPVFLDFTAEWCLTCKVNENGALATDTVRAAFKETNAAAFRADWTRQPAEITNVLRYFGRAGVPLYVIFPAKNPGEPILLEGVITPSEVTRALKGKR